jgi:hypothetical protein
LIAKRPQFPKLDRFQGAGLGVMKNEPAATVNLDSPGAPHVQLAIARKFELQNHVQVCHVRYSL